MMWTIYIVIIILVLALVLAIGFIPAYIAHKRKCQNRIAISLLCIAGLGTGILWIAALIWAYTDKPEGYVPEVKNTELKDEVSALRAEIAAMRQEGKESES